MLVIGGIDVDEIDLELTGQRVRIARAGAPHRTFDRFREAQLELLVRPRRPFLQKGHLQPRRAVDPIGRFQQRGEHDSPLEIRELEAVDRVADRVDAASVVRLEVARAAAEHLADVPVATLERSKLAEGRGYPAAVDASNGVNVGLGKSSRVARQIVRLNRQADHAKGLADARGSGKQVASTRHRQPRRDLLDQRYERAL